MSHSEEACTPRPAGKDQGASAFSLDAAPDTLLNDKWRTNQSLKPAGNLPDQEFHPYITPPAQLSVSL